MCVMLWPQISLHFVKVLRLWRRLGFCFLFWNTQGLAVYFRLNFELIICPRLGADPKMLEKPGTWKSEVSLKEWAVRAKRDHKGCTTSSSVIKVELSKPFGVHISTQIALGAGLKSTGCNVHPAGFRSYSFLFSFLLFGMRTCTLCLSMSAVFNFFLWTLQRLTTEFASSLRGNFRLGIFRNTKTVQI